MTGAAGQTGAVALQPDAESAKSKSDKSAKRESDESAKCNMTQPLFTSGFSRP